MNFQLGLPSTVQFYEVFGMDEELLAMVGGVFFPSPTSLKHRVFS